MTQIGKPISRLEGQLKVSGAAKYAGDYNVPDLLFGYVVNSTVTKGKIISIDTSEALALHGVVKVFTHENRPSTAWFDIQYADMDAPPGTVFKPLDNEEVKYNGQPIALVVANNFEIAREASILLKITYEAAPFETRLDEHLDKARNAKTGLATALKPRHPNRPGILSRLMMDRPIKCRPNTGTVPSIITPWNSSLRPRSTKERQTHHLR
jgi:xanthine dehydrogenase YagR molybdenum-binding subunit